MESRKYQGMVICRERQRRNWSQEQLCRDICTVSYLSKIETGKADPSEEIMHLLFARLGLQINEKIETESRKLAEEGYELLFSGMTEKLKDLFSQKDINSYQAAGCGIDLILIKQVIDPTQKELSLPDESLTECMDRRQLALYRILQQRPQDAILNFPNAYTYLQAGIRNYTLGNNSAAIDQLLTAYDLAARRGFARMMLRAKLYLGNCYCTQLDYENMERHYQIARNLAMALGEQHALDLIAYNTAASQIQSGHYEEAYSFFSQLKDPNKMELHKLAICCEKTGRRSEGIEALDRAETMNAVMISSELARKLCRLVRIRLEHEDYLEHAEYTDLLQEVYNSCISDLPIGYAWFHLPWMIEWLKATRQYKKACKLLFDFPALSFLKEI